MSVAPYPEYKDSGVEWIGAIPKPWSAKRLSFLFRVIGSGTTPPTDGGSYYDGELPWVTTGELREAGISDTAKKLTYDALTAFSTLRMYPPGTLLIAMYGATIGRLGWLSVSACTNQACCALAAPQGVIPRFAFFALLAANEALILLASGGGQPNINQEKIRAFRLPMPSLIEQEAIAAFLDQETGKIDALVAEQERLIALLKEKRQAVISQAVTKGLNPNAPMKDSGIEWLGQVPAHWRVGKVGHFCHLRSGFAFASDAFGVEGIAVVRMNNLRRGKLDLGDAARVPESACVDAASLTEGDLVWGMSGSTGETGSLGNYARVSADDLPCQLNQRVGRFEIREDALETEFLELLIQTNYFYEQIMLFVTGTAQYNVSAGQVQSCIVAVPSINEQRQLSAFIRDELAKIDTLTTEATQAITLLRERRAALISAAVTGKIDVRSLTPTKQEAA